MAGEEVSRGKMKEVIEEAKKEVDEELKKSDEEILFPDSKIGKFNIRPWTLGKLLKINPHIEAVFERLLEKRIKLTMDNIDDFIGEVYFAAFPQLVEIMAISLDVSQEELYDLELKDIVQVVYVIFLQNQENLKNVLALLQTVKQKKEETE